MAGVNKAILIGNLGKDPEIRRLESGATVASFSLATSESYKNREGERVTKTEWHNIVLWRGLAEIAEKYLKKGNSVYIEGKIQTRSYGDEGNKKYITEIVADQMTMLGSKRDNEESQSQAPKPQNTGAVEQTNDDDDLPF